MSISGSPVLFFLPALDEAGAVAEVLSRIPTQVAGHGVVRLVVDDGSTDATATLARSSGAEVVSFADTQGLGAAVRHGLAHGADMRAAAVVFCDADLEYDPSEVERLVAPILAGEADYVVGSRFAGGERRMSAHRAFGNRILTLVVRRLTRLPVTDGQSGFRALSMEAAGAAEVIHDYNYAQVLTLDLAAKGYRYLEVPISYRFRTTGRSFVRVGPYLRAVVPAIWRQHHRAGARVREGHRVRLRSRRTFTMARNAVPLSDPSAGQSSTTKERKSARAASQAA